MRSILSVIFVLVMVELQPLTAESISFSLDKYGRILVPIELGQGETHHFLLDTAARRFGVTQGMASTERVKTYNRRNIRHMSSSGLLNLPLAKISTMKFLINERTDLIAGVLPNSSEAVGLAGFDAYHGYVLHIDPALKKLELHANPGKFAKAGWRVVTGNPNSYGGLLLETSYRGESMTIILASGLSHSTLDIKLAARLFPDKANSLHVIPGQETSVVEQVRGFDTKHKVVSTLIMDNFSIGDWNLGDLEVAVRSWGSKKVAGTGNSGLLMLGADVLANTEYALDSRSHLVWLPPKQ